MRVVELNGEQAARVVRDWGYFRPIDDAEVVHSKWFGFGGHVVWWLNRNAWHEGGEVALHICSDPRFRNKIFARKLLYGIEIVAELMGADRLLTWLEPDALVAGYLGRLGWEVLPERSRDGLVAWARALED